MTDFHILFDGFIALAGFLGGFLLKRIFVMLDKIEKDLGNMPFRYVAKDDYREDIREIKDLLGDIFHELKTKVDKP